MTITNIVIGFGLAFVLASYYDKILGFLFDFFMKL